MIEKRIGKITSARFGLGGYQDAMIGLNLTFQSDAWGVSTEKSAWDCSVVKHSEHCKWTEAARSQEYDEIVRFVSKILNESKVESVDKLVGKPVEVEFEGNCIKDWRILTEAI